MSAKTKTTRNRKRSTRNNYCVTIKATIKYYVTAKNSKGADSLAVDIFNGGNIYDDCDWGADSDYEVTSVKKLS